jgi:peptidoglycan/xylan/chitin deacetylase (PgdA/CDA1 family)
MSEFINHVREALERRRYQWFNQRQTNIVLGTGVVSFTFDDFPATAAHQGAVFLEKQGWRGTFYLSPGLMDSDTAVGRIASASDVERLHRGGHEIGSHTHSHMSCQKANRSSLVRDLQMCADNLKRFGVARNFAFPYGGYDESALNFFSSHYDTIRTVQKGINSGMTDLNLLKANPIYESSDVDKVGSLIEQVRSSGGWLIFYTHDICADPSDYGCTPDRFQLVIDLVRKAGLEVRTIAETFSLVTGLN